MLPQSYTVTVDTVEMKIWWQKSWWRKWLFQENLATSLGSIPKTKATVVEVVDTTVMVAEAVVVVATHVVRMIAMPVNVLVVVIDRGL